MGADAVSRRDPEGGIGMATPASSGASPLGISTDVIEHLAHSDRLLTAKELARLLAVGPKTLYSYVSRNLISYYKLESNVRFRGRDIAEWLRQRAA
jgi:excisionase family DNA binding protein